MLYIGQTQSSCATYILQVTELDACIRDFCKFNLVTICYVTEFAKTVPIDTTIEIH